MSTKSQTRPGTNPQMTKQSFITAEVAKVGSIEALAAKFSTSVEFLQSWIDGTDPPQVDMEKEGDD